MLHNIITNKLNSSSGVCAYSKSEFLNVVSLLQWHLVDNDMLWFSALRIVIDEKMLDFRFVTTDYGRDQEFQGLYIIFEGVEKLNVLDFT